MRLFLFVFLAICTLAAGYPALVIIPGEREDSRMIFLQPEQNTYEVVGLDQNYIQPIAEERMLLTDEQDEAVFNLMEAASRPQSSIFESDQENEAQNLEDVFFRQSRNVRKQVRPTEQILEPRNDLDLAEDRLKRDDHHHVIHHDPHHHGGHGHSDHVDYGAYTGNKGAFGWYSDHPVGYHRR